MYETFEYMEVLLQTKSECVRLCVVYRPPSSSKPQFLEDFSTYIDGLATMSGKLLVLGDFNIHIEKSTDEVAQKLRDLVYSFNLEQHINQATHEKGHTLDLVMTREDESIVSSLSVTPAAFSDHHVVKFNIPGKTTIGEQKTIKVRNLKGIDISKLKEDIEMSLRDLPQDLDERVQFFNTTLSDLMEKHAPEQEKVVKLRPYAPWYNNRIQQAKQERRKAERRWKKTGLEIDQQIVKEKHRLVQNMCAEAKKKYYNDKINDNEANSKALFQISSALLQKEKNTALPSHSSPDILANIFAGYFTEKISKIRNELSQSITTKDYPHTERTNSSNVLDTFHTVTEDEVAKEILTGNSKSCSLDPIPTKILKQVLPSVLPTVTSIINESITRGCMPGALK